jgi:hypothetical protein
MHPQTQPDAVAGGHLISAGLALAGCAVLVIWMGVAPGAFAQVAQAALAGIAGR